MGENHASEPRVNPWRQETFPCPGWWLKPLRNKRIRKWLAIAASAVVLLATVHHVLIPIGFEWYTGVINEPLHYPNSVEVSSIQFERIADELSYEGLYRRATGMTATMSDSFTRKVRMQMIMRTPSFKRTAEFAHIRYFREAGIRHYKGPETCLRCHEDMTVRLPDGSTKIVDTMDDILNTVHMRFQSMGGGFSTIGYDGRQVNKDTRTIPVGKIDRACGVPGSFTWTGWASLIRTVPEHANGDTVLRSEGCGQCHIGGGYHPNTENMMPGNVVPTPDVTKDGVDCLVCHATAYDMNQRYVVKDEYGLRWNQDRSLKSAMSVGRPGNDNCLNCHQHNMGGDTYSYNKAAKSLGVKNRRLLHSTAKRGSPYSAKHDVHVRAGLVCLDCHKPQGHKIPRGNLSTDLVANDLPGVRVDCEMCHTSAPHMKEPRTAAILNGHTSRLACESCHLKNLMPFNNVLKDWINPVWDKHEGMFVPKDVYSSGEPGKGFQFLWFNGYGTFLANALGAHPDGHKVYNPLMGQMVKIDDEEILREIARNTRDIRKKYGIDSAAYFAPIRNSLAALSPEMLERRKKTIEKNLRPRMNSGKSRIYPFKMFNAQMYEDMNNEGPFGAMILPFDYPTYFETGDAEQSVRVAIANPIVKGMYGQVFKHYMMDEFMAYFGVGEWTTKFPLDEGNWNVKPRWMRQMGTLMVNHGISETGRECAECHAKDGIMDFKKLGYPAERVKKLQNPPEMKWFTKKAAKVAMK